MWACLIWFSCPLSLRSLFLLWKCTYITLKASCGNSVWLTMYEQSVSIVQAFSCNRSLSDDMHTVKTNLRRFVLFPGAFPFVITYLPDVVLTSARQPPITCTHILYIHIHTQSHLQGGLVVKVTIPNLKKVTCSSRTTATWQSLCSHV